MVTNAIVSSDGTVLWMYPALIKTYCTLNVKYFPFDSQDCDIQFISWTHNGEQLDIFHNDTMKTAVYYASANQVNRAIAVWLSHNYIGSDIPHQQLDRNWN